MIFSTQLKESGTTDSWKDYLPSAPYNATEHNIKSDNTPISCWLNQFSALKISGPDAERFLQGQLTCNLDEINTETVVYGACCTAKGRTVANFNISFDGENYWLVLPTESALVLEKYLQKYKVFFKATIDNCEQSHLIFGQWANGEAGKVVRNNDNHYLQISQQRRLLILNNQDSSDNENNAEVSNLTATLNWRLADIADGIYYVTADQSELWIPQHINLHQTGGISFNKGCYTGQEIIARLQYLGKAKKALYHFSATDEATATKFQTDKPTAIFNATGKNMGQILFSRTHATTEQINQKEQATQLDLLAVLNTDAPDETLYLTESKEFPLTLQNLSYTEKKTIKTV